MTKQPRYLLDADSFIRSKREHYAFDFCPGYWDALLLGHRRRRLYSIAPVRKELMRGKDALADWVGDKVPESFFEPVNDPDVQAAYAQVIQRVEDTAHYNTAAKHKFASSADPWLVAVARTENLVVVTYEVSSPESKAIIKLPDVARRFKVVCKPPYVMLRQLRVKLTLQ